MPWVAQESFASGELSPSVYGLVSTAQYRTGCISLTNALLTSSGSARKRFGTEDIIGTTSGFPAALFLYLHGGRRFVVQFVSEDDDAGDLNTAQRQVRVLDADTRAFISFSDNVAHGPFDQFLDTGAYFHHFTATELASVYAFQDGTRIVFCHPSRPPLFLERRVVGSTEAWKYGIVASEGPPPIVDESVPIAITFISTVSPNEIEASSPIFTKPDELASWRIGSAVDPVANPLGFWIRTNRYISPTRMSAAILYGAWGQDANDWAGPYKETTTSSGTTTISSLSNAPNDIRTFTAVTPFAMSANHVGSIASIASVIWLITAVASATSFTAKRIEGVGSISGAGLPLFLMAIGWDATFGRTNRAWIKRQPIYFSAQSGIANLTSIEPLITQGTGTNQPWLPPGHETTFDRVGGTLYGGAVIGAGGVAAITSLALTGGPGANEPVYSAQILRRFSHESPIQQWKLGWSNGVGFPRCGVAHQGRHYFGGFALRPRVLVASRTGSLDDFTTGPLDDDALNITMTDPTAGVPTWMDSASDLLVGTTTGEFAIAGAPITAANLAVERQSGYGGLNLRPALVGGAALFGSGRGIREMAFLFDRDRYESPDLTDHAKHIFADETIAQIEYLSTPLQTVYVRTASGKVHALSYWRANGIVGWSQFTQPVYPTATGTAEETSTIESIAAVRAGGPIVDDELWLVRRYTTAGQSGAGTVVRRIERMTPAFVVDQSWTDTTPTSTQVGIVPHIKDLSQAAHLPQVLLDGVYIGSFAVNVVGNATYPDVGFTPTTGVFGRAIPFELIAYVQAAVDARTGATQGRIESVAAAKVLLVTSKGGTVDGKRLGREQVPAAVITTPITEITEWRPVAAVGEHGVMAQVNLAQSVPYHFEVGGVSFQVTFGA